MSSHYETKSARQKQGLLNALFFRVTLKRPLNVLIIENISVDVFARKVFFYRGVFRKLSWEERWGKSGIFLGFWVNQLLGPFSLFSSFPISKFA